MEFSDLQDTLEKQICILQEILRGGWIWPKEYYNGAIFGFDPTKSPEEVDENWSVRVIPMMIIFFKIGREYVNISKEGKWMNK